MANKSYEWNEKESKYWDKRIEQHSDKDPKSLIYKELLQFNKNNAIKKGYIKHRPINILKYAEAHA